MEKLFARYEYVPGLIVGRQNEVLFQAGELDELVDVRSITKTVLSIVAGLAMEQMRRFELQTPVRTFVEHAPSDLTVQDLLTLRSGFLIEDKDLNAMLLKSTNWVQDLLQLPREQNGGFRYKGVDHHLLSAFLTQVVEMRVSEYARQQLFEPLGIQNFSWPADPQGISIGSTGLKLSARSLLAVGKEHGRLLSAEWVRQATSRHIETGLSYGDFGYGWWIRELHGVSLYRAMGNGGNQVVNIPSLGLTIVVLGIVGHHDHEGTDRLLIEVLQIIT